MKAFSTTALLASLLLTAGIVEAQNGRRPGYDKLDAGAEAYLAQEAQRLDAIDRQIGLNESLYLWSRPWLLPAPYARPWPLLWDGPLVRAPLVERRVRQPIGRVEQQLGPNTWYSGPLYADELYADDLYAEEAVIAEPQFEQEAEVLEAEDLRTPTPYVPPRPAGVHGDGPREF